MIVAIAPDASDLGKKNRLCTPLMCCERGWRFWRSPADGGDPKCPMQIVSTGLENLFSEGAGSSENLFLKVRIASENPFSEADRSCTKKALKLTGASEKSSEAGAASEKKF